VEMALDYARRARICLREAELALREGYPSFVIRRSQEALELAVKALLRALGVEYPKRHDVSDILLERRESLPEPIRSEVEELAKLLAELAALRGPAFYGFEEEGIPAEKAFKMEYAGRLYLSVRRYVEEIVNALERILPPELGSA
ncbi:MAG: HEPN domain-containing protein, partial [Thermofilaceae archaeon]